MTEEIRTPCLSPMAFAILSFFSLMKDLSTGFATNFAKTVFG